MNKFLDAIKRHTGLKVFSLIIAILLWAFVQLAQNPEVTYDVKEIPITITGEADINSEGYVISSVPKNLTATVQVSAKRSYLSKIDPESFSAYVDVSNAKTVGEYSFSVWARSDDGNITVDSTKPSTISLYVDQVITVKKPIKLSYDGSLNPEYYIDKNNIKILPETATVKVPKLVEPKITEVVLHLDLTDVTSDIHGEFPGIAVDNRGEEVTDKFLTITDENILVQVPILKRKTVPITIKNLPKDMEYNLNLEQIEIAGKEADIAKITEIEGVLQGYHPNEVQPSYNVSLKLPTATVLTEEKEVKLFIAN